MNERRVTHLWRVRAIVVRRLRSRGRVVCVRRRREASWSGEYVYDTHGIVTLRLETPDSRRGARGVAFFRKSYDRPSNLLCMYWYYE